MLAAVAYIVYVLWPRWPGAPVALDAPALPITIAGVAFNVPPAAIRMPVQRRPGAQERIDLAFMWPSLKPADTAPKPGARRGPRGRRRHADARSHLHHHRARRRRHGAGRARAHDLSALCRRRAGVRPDRPRGARVPGRHALSGRGSDLRCSDAGELPGPLHPQRRRRHARHLSLRAARRGRGRYRGALPARLARGLAVGRREHRSADRRTAAAARRAGQAR